MLLSIHIREMNAVLLVRVFLGLLFLCQGYDKVFRVKVKNVIENIHTPMAQHGVPEIFSVIGAYFTSYIELICGATLILGFCTYWSLYLLGFDLLFVAFAFSIVEPMWDMKHIFPRLILLVILLILPSQWDVISVDYAWSLFNFIHKTF
jgi:uncharacterized membrane protein YphA (DoxX/SURF4 family)